MKYNSIIPIESSSVRRYSIWSIGDHETYQRNEALLKQDFLPISYAYHPRSGTLKPGLLTVCRNDFKDYPCYRFNLEDGSRMTFESYAKKLPDAIRVRLESWRMICMRVRIERDFDAHGDPRVREDMLVISANSRIFFEFDGKELFFVGGYYYIRVFDHSYRVYANNVALSSEHPCRPSDDVIDFVDTSGLSALRMIVWDDLFGWKQ